MGIRKNKRVIRAYINGKLLVDDVIQAALDNNMMVDDMKKVLIDENPHDEITFRAE